MSNIRPHQRVFALVAALLFLATSVATGALVVWQIRQDNAQTANTPSKDSASKQASLNDSCNIQEPVESGAEAVPETYKPEGDVTELQVTDLQPGSGQTAKAGDCLVVKYQGTLASSGEKFDGNFDTPQALQFRLGQGNVIPGWDQGLNDMKAGGTRRLVIPAELAYRDTGQGSIPPNADLVFVVKLVEIKQ